ncbi:MAG: hypothetical protein HY057_00620 [Rhodospirillales bacterium]|nr:hypothetical protein [Rhodospirillales bacterium]
MVSRFFETLERQASPLLAVALFIGIAVPDLARLMKPLLGPAIFLLLAATLLRLDWTQVFASLNRPRPLVIMLVWGLLVCPLLVAGAVWLLDLPDELGEPMVLMASSPALISVPTFALILGLDAPFALVAMVAMSLLQPFIQSPVALALLDLDLDIGLAPLMLRLIAFVGGPFVLALAARRLIGPARLQRAAHGLGGFAVLMLIVFAIGVVDGVTATLIERPGHVFLFLAAAFLSNFMLQAATAAIFWQLAPYLGMTRREALTAALVAGSRNLAILVAVLGPSADPDLFLYLACGQFPMYLIPALLGPVYRAFRTRIS